MKRRQGFVSNSSSCAFIIVNNGTKPKTLVDFLDENPELWEKYWEENQEDVEIAGCDLHGLRSVDLNKQSVLQAAALFDKLLQPGENYVIFHDDGQVLHEVVLHDTLEKVTPSRPEWSWRFDESFH